MIAAWNANVIAPTKFGIGQPVPREKDPMLLRDEGRYTDDWKLLNQVYAVRTSGLRP